MMEAIRTIPPKWGKRAIGIRKFRVRAHFDCNDLIGTANAHMAVDIDTPWGLARAPKPRTESLATADERTSEIHLL